MAFDYGSIDLGLKNPFKPEGRITAFRGVLQLLAGIYLLFTAVKIVKTDAGAGWILVVFGIFVLSLGIRALGSGIYATLRYFVGRNHPTSLARNFNKSDATKSDQESDYVAYTAQVVEEMLVGRKNATFLEPQGWAHSHFPGFKKACLLEQKE
ncbi:MAG: hypothetical protein HUK40_06755 [Desulfobacter sp.]|nr:hypothetical protein [Desulfobacter sp.]